MWYTIGKVVFSSVKLHVLLSDIVQCAFVVVRSKVVVWQRLRGFIDLDIIEKMEV